MASRRGFEESDSDGDDCSVSSKWTSQSEPEENYAVDYILAQKEDEKSGEDLFLVKWTGYDESRLTWEPAANLGSTTMDQWRDRKLAIQCGFETPFTLEIWERNQRTKTESDKRRWQRRARMLTRRNGWAEPPEDHPAAVDVDSSSDGEEPESIVLSPRRRLEPEAGRKTSAARSRLRVKAAASRSIKKMQGL